jgi:hypothetical protein
MARLYPNYLLSSNRNEYSFAVVLLGEYGRTVPLEAKSEQRSSLNWEQSKSWRCVSDLLSAT